jgi:TRAP-type C4-dicarboxylate transport system permease small subunit
MDALIAKLVTLIVNPIIELLIAVALIVFLWGVFQYFVKQNSSEARSTATQHMLYGIIGLFIMISVFGIINAIMNTLNVPQDQRPSTIPGR